MNNKRVGVAGILALVFFMVSNSMRAMNVAAPQPLAATDAIENGVHNIYYPVQGSAALNCNKSQVYPSSLGTPPDPSQTTTYIQLQITPTTSLTQLNGGTFPTGPSVFSIRVESSTNPGTALPIVDLGGAIGAIGYQTGSVTEVQYGVSDLTMRQIGVYFQNQSGSTGLCELNSWGSLTDCQTGTSASEVLNQLNVGIALKGVALNSGSTSIDQAAVTVIMVDCPPHTVGSPGALVGPSPLSYGLTPGDTQISISNSSTAPVDIVPVNTVIAYGTSTSTVPTFTNSLSSTGGFQTPVSLAGSTGITGLTNDTQYCVGLGYVNEGGLVATDVAWSANIPANSGSGGCVTPSRIDGFLSRSQCFIASAAYGEEWDSRLVTLRAFRDKVLLHHAWGRGFVHWYYGWSPAAAHWIWKHPTARAVVRGFLRPVVAGAHLFLNAFESDAHAADSSDEMEPYIQKLRKQYNIQAPPPDNSATQSAPAPLGAAPPATPPAAENSGSIQPYIDRMQQQIQEKEAAEGHSSAPAAGSSGGSDAIQPYIESVKAGKELEPKYRGTVQNGAGLAVMASSQFQVSASNVQANNFNTVYDTQDKYVPGADLYYERQLYRDTRYGSFGLIGHVMFIEAFGHGIFTEKQVQSQTQFRFTAVPLSAGGSYHFLMGRFVQPFAQAGLVAVPMNETRNDGLPSRRSLSDGYDTILGIALNVDWVSRSDAWTRYDSYGVLHTYLTIQWERMHALGGPVSFNYNAMFAGLGFEF